MGYYKWNDEELGKAIEYRLYRKGSITEKEFSDMMADRLSKREIMWKYSKALQEVQRERNALRAENEKLKQQLAENNQIIKETKNCEYVWDVRDPNVIKKIYYDEEKNYMVESMAPLGIFEELEKLQQENADLESKLTEKEKDKISFALEQIMQIIEKINNSIIEKINNSEKNIFNSIQDWLYELDNIFDTQIEQLKEDKGE